MIEMIIVIVVLGLLAALAIPRLERDLRQEAGDNILSAIRYTQHLALMDNKFEHNDRRWQRKYWAIQFTTSTANTMNNFYIICSDNDKSGTYTKGECATDPLTGKYYYNAGGVTTSMQNDESPSIFIGKKYGIDTLTTSGSCAGTNTIGFDYMGRPVISFLGSIKPDYSSVASGDCNLTFSSSEGAFSPPITITITKETGYAYIDGEPGS